MRMLYRDGLPVAPFACRSAGGKTAMTVVVKATLRLVHDGTACLRPEQPHMSGDVPDPDGGEGAAPLYEADLTPFKPSTDAVVVGNYYSPRGRLVPHGRAELNVGPIRHVVDVIGRRTWNLGLLRGGASDPEPFRTLPLRWEYAFGGEEFAANPTGRGHVTKALRKRTDGPYELPRIEWPDQHVRSMTDEVEPANLGPLPRHWGQRARLLGTLDERWERELWPGLPEDFDPDHFCCAPPAMRMDGYLKGDETIALGDVHPEHRWFETSLPGLQAVAGVRRKRATPDGGSEIDRVEPFAMHLDTLWVDAESETAVVLWRGRVPVADAEFSDIEYLWADLREGRHGRREIAISAAAAIRADESEWNIASESPPDEPVEAAPGSVSPGDPGVAPGPTPEAGRSDPSDDPQDADLEAWVTRGQEATDAALADLQQQFPPTPAMAAKLATIQEQAERDAAAGEDDGPAEAAPGSASPGDPGVAPGPTPEAERSGPADDPQDADLEAWVTRGQEATDAALADLRQQFPPTPAMAAKLATIQEQAERDAAAGEDDGPAEARWNAERVRERLASGGSLAGEDLTGVDLSGVSLVEADLTGAILDGATLAGCDLTSARCEGASLFGARLGRARLTDAGFEGAVLEQVDAAGVEASRCRFASANLQGSNWTGAVLERADLSGCTASGARLDGARLDGAILAGASFDGANFDGARLAGVDARAADLSRASLRSATMTAATLGEADLSGAVLEGAQLEEADLTDADLEGVQARGSNLAGARIEGLRAGERAVFVEACLDRVEGRAPIFTKSDLGGASLEYARMPGVDLSDARLVETRFAHCDLRGARMDRADLTGSTLVDSDCFEATFEGARLDDVDGGGSSFYGAEFLDASVDGFGGRGRDLSATKLAGRAAD